MSTVGESPVTVIDSASEPTRRSALTAAVNADVNSTPSRFTVLKPVNVNVTEYVPGTRLTILYWPAASVTTVRTRSMSDGLAASTVTPGMTAPVASLTTPAMLLPLWANPSVGSRRRIASTTEHCSVLRTLTSQSGFHLDVVQTFRSAAKQA